MPRRLYALDGLRGLLALYILAGHTLPYLRLPPVLLGIGVFVSHGRGAVDLFFILSGLVIIGSLDQIAVKPQPVWRFLLARAGRLLPVYFLALILAAVVLCLGDPFTSMSWLPPGGAPREIQQAGWPSPWFWHLSVHLLLLQGLMPPMLLPNGEFFDPGTRLEPQHRVAILRPHGSGARLVRGARYRSCGAAMLDHRPADAGRTGTDHGSLAA